MENNFKNDRSQLCAKILAVVNSLIALPGLVGTASSVLLFMMALDNIAAGIYPLVVTLGIWLITLAGLILLFGYWQHAYGKLSPIKTKVLWVSTIIFNALLLIPISIVFCLAFADGNHSLVFFAYLVFNFSYCAVAIGLSSFALRQARDEFP